MSAAATPVRARIPTLQKLGQLCERFSSERPRWRPGELARDLDWDPATTHRFLKALTEIRVLTEHDDGAYGVGMLPVELAAVYLGGEPRRQALVERCEAIAEGTGLTCQLGVLRGAEMAIVASREGGSALRASAMLGERLPLHATAGGKAILSQLGDAEIESLLPARLEPLTEATITSRDELIAAVAGVRESGLAVASAEFAPAFHAIGVPLPRRLFDQSPAALMCAGPQSGTTPEQWQQAERLLRETAAS